ncbi:hypothetical protein [Actinopolyspora lacussalsi]|nr:hypothetical protein [Actinopolyspora righensis]
MSPQLSPRAGAYRTTTMLTALRCGLSPRARGLHSLRWDSSGVKAL